MSELMPITIDNFRMAIYCLKHIQSMGKSIYLHNKEIKSSSIWYRNLECFCKFLIYKFQISFVKGNINLLKREKLMNYFEYLDDVDIYGFEKELLLDDNEIDVIVSSILNTDIVVRKLNEDKIIYIISDKYISNYIIKHKQDTQKINEILNVGKNLIYYMPRYVSNVMNSEIFDMNNNEKAIKITCKIDTNITKEDKYKTLTNNVEIYDLIYIYNFIEKLRL